MMDKGILNEVNKYYSSKIIENGATSVGVDWNSQESHYMRFNQLTKNIEKDVSKTILDFGCGYGALIDFLKLNSFTNYSYFGFDISE